ncbi:Holliday junction branch migration protein RuvA [Candidatus Uhrbacteria bacterium]|nr:Holliday junction branch migration protein RuvA [Candidatus Uhrbacteria bacterium]
MFAFLRGTVHSLDETSLVVEVHDIGYRIFVSGQLLLAKKKGDGIELHLYHHIRENGQDLYGFEDKAALLFFEKLLSVSGVGPKTALSILGVTSLQALTANIAQGDSTLLKSVSGVGTKTAERIVVELKNSMKAYAFVADGEEFSDKDILDALTNLGYPHNRAREALQSLPRDLIGEEERLKAALRYLSAV